MKWTSANSSDRKSVFYTSEDANSIKEQRQQQQKSKGNNGSVTDSSNSLFTFKMGVDDETAESQNSKSSSNSNSIERHNNNNASSSNGNDLKRYLKNFMLFSNLEIESEKKCRDEQLSRVVKALMMFEKKLRKEQEIIQQQLCEKDRVINRQMHTISNMKEKLGAEHQIDDDEAISGTAEFCPMCRKKYYLRASKNTATQTSLKGFTNNISDDYSSIQSVEYMSSSEEQEALLSPNPFSTARRSKKYTSKKSYKEYLQSRPHHNNSASSECSSNRTTPKDFLVNSDRNNNNTISAEHTNSGKEIGISKSASCGGAAKFSLIMNDIHGIKQQKQQSCDDTHSLKINRMHGISLTTLNTTVNEMKEKEMPSHHNNNNNSGDDSSNNDNQTAIKVTVGDDKTDLNANGCDGVTTRKKYCDEGLNVKQKIATRDDWYISDIEENDTTLGGTKSPYGNGVSNSVLECVNQILLQQSMDEYIESKSESKPKETTKESTTTAPTRSNKRVHFSTKNSMVQIKPRHRHHSPDLHLDHHDVPNSTYENQSTYSNEYELIGSSSRTYVDMDIAKSETFKPKLPPKPDNLMKLQQIAKQRAFVQDQIYTRKNSSDYELNESEPDYASISEIQDSITSVKVVTAEVHNSADDDDGNSDDADDNEYSEIKELPTPTPTESDAVSVTVTEDDSFADVPKLPNVYSIIPGIETTPTSPTKKDSPGSKCIGHDNYITKSPIKKKPPIAFASIKKEKEKVTTEINGVKKQTPPVPLKLQQTIKIIDEKIQQEFDWYNLDAEYTKTDIVITPQIENIEEMYQFDDENVINGEDAVKVEYNLEDFEYETVPSSSDCSAIEIETNNNNFTTVIKINESNSSSASSSSSTSEAPASPIGKTSTTANLMELAETPKIDFKKTNKIRYEKFLKESGLISKPILSSKKKFYAGSFV